MATKTATWTGKEVKAAKTARRLFPDVAKGVLATRIIKAGKLGRGRPKAEFAGLPGVAKVLTGRTAGSIARYL